MMGMERCRYPRVFDCLPVGKTGKESAPAQAVRCGEGEVVFKIITSTTTT
jgi:hypothetical protein